MLAYFVLLSVCTNFSLKIEVIYRASSVRRTYEAFLCTVIMGIL